MVSHLVSVGESVVAVRALKWRLLRVLLDVDLEVELVVEGLVAEAADPGPSATVDLLKLN